MQARYHADFLLLMPKLLTAIPRNGRFEASVKQQNESFFAETISDRKASGREKYDQNNEVEKGEKIF